MEIVIEDPMRKIGKPSKTKEQEWHMITGKWRVTEADRDTKSIYYIYKLTKETQMQAPNSTSLRIKKLEL